MRVAHIFTLAAYVATARGPLPSGIAQNPIISLLSKWHDSVDSPLLLSAGTLASYDAELASALDQHPLPAEICGALHSSVINSNVMAMRRLLRALSPAELEACVSVVDRHGVTLVHRAALSLSVGVARIALHLELVESTAEDKLSRQRLLMRMLGLQCLPDASGSPTSHDFAPLLSKAAIEACMTAAPLRALAGALALTGSTRPGLLASALTRLAGAPDPGRPDPAARAAWRSRLTTPLGQACAAGNVRAAELLFSGAGLPALAAAVWDAEARQSGLGSSCAHLAAARGLVPVLEALRSAAAALAGPASNGTASRVQEMLSQPDGFGRTPLDAARLAGPAGAATIAWLCEHGVTGADDVACAAGPSAAASRLVAIGAASMDAPVFAARVRDMDGMHRADASKDSPSSEPPSGLSVQSEPPVPPPLWRPGGFSAAEHEAAGWGAPAAPAELRRHGLPPLDLGDDPLDPLRFWHGNAASEPLPSLRADEAADAAGQQLWERLGSLDLPFVVRGALGPPLRNLTRGAEARAAGQPAGQPWAPLPAAEVKRAWGGLRVSAGTLPYPDLYGGASDTAWTLGAFVDAWMGPGPAAARRRDADAGGPPPPPPPCVFDRDALEAHPELFDALLGSLPASLRPQGGRPRLSQLALGPALSGAMLHFHGPAVNALAVGLKLWVLLPPGSALFSLEPALAFFAREMGYTVSGGSGGSASEAIRVRPDGGEAAAAAGALPSGAPPQASLGGVGGRRLVSQPHYVALQAPGDVVVVPRHWAHAVLNLADTVAVALEGA